MLKPVGRLLDYACREVVVKKEDTTMKKLPVLAIALWFVVAGSAAVAAEKVTLNVEGAF